MKNYTDKITLSYIVIFSFISALVFAQNPPKVFGRTVENVNPENGLIRCASSEYEKYLQQNNPQRATSQEFEQWLAPKIEAVKAQRMASPEGTTQVITIPVVVHVIHNGDPVGSSENIADAQVISQITVLNQDFRRMAGTPGFNANPVGADVEIEFCLAKIDPDGNPTNGIDRVNLGQSSWNSEDSIEWTLKPQTQWDPSLYFNIWVCNFGGNMSDILGYAQFPDFSGLPGLNSSGGSPVTDGVVIGYAFFGSSAIYPAGNYAPPYNRGRTTTHEVGHALGLRHIWGDSFGQNGCSVDDFCADTPNASDANYGCTFNFSCQSPDMIENYMDYTNDSCMSVFTQNQKARMLAVMQNSPRRASLVTSNVCQLGLSNDDFELLNGINIYPNPTQNVLNIAVQNGELPDNYTIYNSLGQVMVSTVINSESQLQVNTSSYSNGIYFIKINKGTQTKTVKFVKK